MIGEQHPDDDDIMMKKIHVIRQQKVMLDKDLAELYGVKPIRLREQVKRNRDRFPPQFMFQLTENEALGKVSQNAIPSSKQRLGGSLPYAFTEHGVLMLANVLKSKTAVSVSLRLVEIFVKMREMVSLQRDLLLKVEQLERRADTQDESLESIFSALKQLLEPKREPRTRIGYRLSGDSVKKAKESEEPLI